MTAVIRDDELLLSKSVQTIVGRWRTDDSGNRWRRVKGIDPDRASKDQPKPDRAQMVPVTGRF